MLGRMQRPADFEHALAAQARARSAHFAAHHVARPPNSSAPRRNQPDRTKLSTGDAATCAQPVDESILQGPDRCWFGAVVPKRHARKAATRNLLRRQIRAAMDRHHQTLAHGLWLVRLRAPFDGGKFQSASSNALRLAARSELDALLMQVAA